MALKKSNSDISSIRDKPNKVQKVETLDFAQIERTHALTDGLFRPIDHKVKRPSFHIKSQFKSKTGRLIGLEWQGVQLDVTDQQVFLAILRIVSQKNRQLVASDANLEPLREIEKAFDFSQGAPQTLCAKTSLYEICKVAGFTDGGENIQSVYDSIYRMQCTRCLIYGIEGGKIDKRTEGSFSLIAQWGMKDGNAYIGINPFLTKSILGHFQVAHLDMTHIRILRGDVGKRLFLWLSAWASFDAVQKIGVDKLVKHVWGDEAKDNQALRKRRMKVRAAMAEIGKLDGWKIERNKDDESIFNVKKPKYV